MPNPPTTEELEQHLRVFSLAPGASLPEIKKRWLFLVKNLHPDKVDNDQKDAATAYMIQVNAAWEAINTWFKAHPDAQTTPEKEPAKESSTNNAGAVDDADEDDWEAFERKQQARWKSQDGVSLAELDRKRRHDIVVRARRDAVVKAKIVAPIILFISAGISRASDFMFDAWVVSLVLYLIWVFHPKAKAKTEEWIEKEG